MTTTLRTRARLMGVLALLASPALTGCASQQALRQSLNDRDAEIRDLLEEQTRLDNELRRVRNDRDNLQVALEDATSQLRAKPAPVEAASPLQEFPDLDREGITYGRRGDHIVFSVPSAVTFGAGKASLTDQGRKALKVLAARLKDFSDPAQFYVEGHTDSDPIKKSGFKSNRHLSLERALAVHAFLVTDGQIDDSRFVVVGHGQYDPVASNDSDGNKAKNRRVEVVVHDGR